MGSSGRVRQATVTGLNESRLTPEDVIYARQTAKAMRKSIRLQKREKMVAYLTTTHDFQLWYGDAPFGKPRAMTGQEAYDKNKALELKFFNDKNPEAHLWRWYLVGAVRITKGMTANQFKVLKAAKKG